MTQIKKRHLFKMHIKMHLVQLIVLLLQALLKSSQKMTITRYHEHVYSHKNGSKTHKKNKITIKSNNKKTNKIKVIKIKHTNSNLHDRHTDGH